MGGLSMSKIEIIRDRARLLLSESNQVGVPCSWLLAKFVNEMNLLVTQSKCEHKTLKSRPYKTHGSEGLIWECSECKKMIDVEISD
jgi:hypothetical protein